jgi:hypothetical protein
MHDAEATWKTRYLRCEQGVGCGLSEKLVGGSMALVTNVPRIRERNSRTRAYYIGQAANP